MSSGSALAWNVLALAIPSQVIWSYSVFAVVTALGLISIFFRGYWLSARGIDRLLLFGPIFFGAPLAAFGTEHFTLTPLIASIIPEWIPWHIFWTYLVGSCFIAAGLSLGSRIQSRLAASLVALTFFLFVVLMEGPGWLHRPRDRFALAVVLRELSFSGGPMAFAVSLGKEWRQHIKNLFATVARFFVAIPVLYYSLMQFLHGDHVAGIPFEPLTPQYVFGRALWTYLAAAVYAVAGILLLIGKKTRAAATCIGLTVLLVVLVEYVPIGVVERASLDKGLNYFADTLMFAGTVLLLATAMPREEQTGTTPTQTLQ